MVHRVATTSSGMVRIWNADGTGQPIELPNEAPERWAHWGKWSPDGSRVMTFSSKTVRIWNADGTGQPIVLSHEAPERWTHRGAWSPDGSRIVTVSRDNKTQISNADRTGQPIVLPHEAAVEWAAWHPDGLRVVTQSKDGAARIWLIDWHSIRAKLWHLTRDYLRARERERYLGELLETATKREAEDRAWIEANAAAEREGRERPLPPR